MQKGQQHYCGCALTGWWGAIALPEVQWTASEHSLKTSGPGGPQAGVTHRSLCGDHFTCVQNVDPLVTYCRLVLDVMFLPVPAALLVASLASPWY